jgi:hypothetical protein
LLADIRLRSRACVRTVLFHRKYRRFHGGHLKVWHYFNHVLATPEFDARALFDVDSSWDSSNPWSAARDLVIAGLEGQPIDALFVAGRDWQRLDVMGLLDRELPILNLIQHVRHADDWSIQSRYLSRKAVRICVSDEVANAVRAAGSVGPIVVIPNGIDIPAVSAESGVRTTDLLIAGLKQPAMATRAAKRLQAPGRTIEVFSEHVHREAFLDAISRARVTLFLPNEEEGFYLPGLEGMALGTVVVCPDCIGNRSYCLPGQNAFRPAFAFEEIIEQTEAALALPNAKRDTMLTEGQAMAERHSPLGERTAFQSVLANLDTLWSTS